MIDVTLKLVGPAKAAADTIYPLLADDRGWADEDAIKDIRDLAYPGKFSSTFKAMVGKKLRMLERKNQDLNGELVCHVSRFLICSFSNRSLTGERI